jgi:hypothetical protein
MGTGEASGDGRAVAAAEAAIANPLIDDVSLKGAKGLIINITGGNDITLYEVDEAANRIKQEVDENANIIYGTTCDERLEGVVRVSIVATGIDLNSNVSPKSLEKIATLSIDNSVYLQKSSETDSDQITINEKIIEDDSEIKNLSSFENANENNLISEEIEDEILKDNSTEENNYLSGTSTKFTEDLQFEEENLSDSSNYDEPKDGNYNPINKDSSEVVTKEIDEEAKPSVRKLSLFDTLESSEKEDLSSQPTSPTKSEPIFEDEITNDKKDDIEEEVIEEEFSAEESDTDEDFNQEVEEELLDIPTFLRRQAN